jgi:hypothetical protein
MKRTIGKITKKGEIKKEYIELNGCFGTIYKNFKAFEDKSKEICYIPEFNDSKYTYNDYIEIAKELFKQLDVEGNPEVLANLLFEFSTWQSPETLIDEWEGMGEFDDYPETHGINITEKLNK